MAKVPEIFGSMVFNDQKMQERLPKSTYKALKKTIQNGEPLDLSVANVVSIFHFCEFVNTFFEKSFEIASFIKFPAKLS